MRDDGFTLIEALVSLAVLALLSLTLIGGLAAPRAVWSRQDASLDRTEAVETAQGVLRERLQRAVPITMYDRRPPGPDFDGLAGQTLFIAPPPQAQAGDGLRRYRLSLDSQSRLVLESRNRMALDQASWPERQVLLTGVQAIDLAYFGPAQPDMTPRWRARWSQQETRPELVRIRVFFPPGDARVWPELLVQPIADIDTECDLDRASKRCKGR